MKHRYPFVFLLSFLFISPAIAQAPKQVIVEHFTNTRCSICANRNPGFYANLENQENVLHIAYHPSSPYSSCVLNQHNKEENDGRTHYYDMYGSTPKLAILGQAISPGANYASDALFDDFEFQTSPVSITYQELRIDGDSIRLTLSINTEASHSLAEQSLFVALAEDTVFYEAPNGEDLHFDVFRKAFTPVGGANLNPSATVGGAVTFSAAVAIHPVWDINRIYPVAILQDASTRSVTQSAAGPVVTSLTTGAQEVQPADFKIFPNPARDFLYIESPGPVSGTGGIYSMQGALLSSFSLEDQQPVDINFLPSGVYVLKLQRTGGIQVRRFVKQF